MMNDIKDLLTMQWLDVSIIQVFIMYLHRLCNQIGIDSVGFLCPTQIAKATLDLNCDVVTAYIGNTMVTLQDKTFILAPYHQSAFRSYMNQRGQRAKKLAQWKNVKCPQQPGGVECGYYVMKYMHDLCTKYSTYTFLDKVFQDRTTPYSIEEIDEIREMWAKYFCKECV
ncbi:PREDICTED: uncharacterized protein LOC109178959 [Ipomoea nil]|uniref:uncharacterized protein LOC109178959 n=1 Tax=Ipomoea nil TaxID=35883 RepID=UPI0009015082|nr:PREDICTED: uncharacterized protein LOC109178959 [Ipomoea nil]